MSGIAGIINLDGAPVDRQLLQQMTQFMTYRGPDAQEVWIDGHVGFGHIMLRTTFESQHERQPCSLDGQVWITADARVDGRRDLIQKLESKGRVEVKAATDVELILHAYHVWGEDCVKYLLGDFAFALWDGRRRRLFCARDHFGVKLFYYAQVANCLVFSNTLNCVRRHPAVTDHLNDLAIGDFLLFGYNPDVSTTTFADIQRLPPAHGLSWSGRTPYIARYWGFPIDGKIIRYKRASDYVDHFQAVLRQAVGDRLRTDRVAVWMSGGLDSTTLAATVCELREKQSMPVDLQAFCIVYDRLIPDEERYYSGLAAKVLGIPIHYLVADDYKLFERWDEPELHWPEPAVDPLLAKYVDSLKQTAAHSRVVLNGEDGDALLNTPSNVLNMLKGMGVGHLVVEVGRYVLSHRRLPSFGTGVYGALKRFMGKGRPRQPLLPVWLNADLATRLNPPARWEQVMNARPNPIHPIRPTVHQRLTLSLWQSFLESLDPGVTSIPLEFRLPFLDRRVVEYALAIPPIPWCVKKELLRVAMRGTLPEPVRRRPKTPLAGYPYHELLRQPDARWVDGFEPIPELAKYVDRGAVPQVAGGACNPDESWLHLRPFSLNHWL